MAFAINLKDHREEGNGLLVHNFPISFGTFGSVSFHVENVIPPSFKNEQRIVIRVYGEAGTHRYADPADLGLHKTAALYLAHWKSGAQGFPEFESWTLEELKQLNIDEIDEILCEHGCNNYETLLHVVKLARGDD